MGYYAHITSYHLRITDEKRGADLLLAAGFGSQRDLGSIFDDEGYEDYCLDDKGNLDMLSFSGKIRLEDDFWRALAPVIDRTTTHSNIVPYVEWLGEDDERWRFVFEDGAMQTVGCDTTWAYEEVKPVKMQASVEPLVLGGMARVAVVDALKIHLSELIHKGVEEDVLREVRMALKTTTDAERIALTLETLT